jgi:hypothetical protein
MVVCAGVQVDVNQETTFNLVDMTNGKVLWKTKERLSNGWPLSVAGELKMTHDAACGGMTLCMTLRTTPHTPPPVAAWQCALQEAGVRHLLRWGKDCTIHVPPEALPARGRVCGLHVAGLRPWLCATRHYAEGMLLCAARHYAEGMLLCAARRMRAINNPSVPW